MGQPYPEWTHDAYSAQLAEVEKVKNQKVPRFQVNNS